MDSIGIFKSFRSRFVPLSYLVVCLASWSFPPSEQQTTLPFHGGEMEVPPEDDDQVYESRWQAQKLLHLESEVISFCWLIIEQDEILHRAEESHHDWEHIKRFLTETQRINDDTQSSGDVIERHPVHVFRLKRRISVTWLPILEDFRECEFISTFLTTSIGFRYVQLSALLLRESDRNRAIDDILSLQRFFCLPTVTLVAGCIHGVCAEPLTLEEVKDIAQEVADRENHGLALEWIETRLSPSCGQNCPVSSSEDDQLGMMRTMRASALLMIGRYAEAKKAYEELFLRSNSSSMAIASILRSIEKRHEEKGSRPDTENEQKNNTVLECNASLCQSEQTSKEDLSLTCYTLNLSATNVNVEILNKDPMVIVIYDFLTSNHVDLLLTVAKRKNSKTTGSYFTQDVRRIDLSSDDQWMDVIGSHYRNITYSQRNDWVELKEEVFNLTVTSIGVGQKINPVSIESETTDENSGTHVGQFHVFLNEPEFGGCLIFPKLKIKVQPMQGAAVFWKYRSPSSLSGDEDEEAFLDVRECPVLLGTQWVAKIPLLKTDIGILNF